MSADASDGSVIDGAALLIPDWLLVQYFGPDALAAPVLVRPVEPQPVIPAGYRRMRPSEISTALAFRARSFLGNPFGAFVPFEDGGRALGAALEQHFHPPGGVARPWGWHKGVSLFIHDGN